MDFDTSDDTAGAKAHCTPEPREGPSGRQMNPRQALADGIGQPSNLGAPWPRRFTIVVLLVGMLVAMVALTTGEKPVRLVIFGQALTVLGNPLMAATLLWLANQSDIMGRLRNKIILNILGGLGLVVVLLMALRVLYLLILQPT